MGRWDEYEHPRDPANGQFVESWVAALDSRLMPETKAARLDRARALDADETLDRVATWHNEHHHRFEGPQPPTGLDAQTLAAASRALGQYAWGGGEYVDDVRQGNLSNEDRADFAAVMRVFDHSRLTEDVILMRGVSNPKRTFGEARFGDLTGYEWTDPGLVSTSAYYHGAQEYMHEKRPIVLEIHAPAGTPAIHLFLPHPRTGVHDDEKEVVLPPGLRYRVTGDTESGWGVRIVSVEVVQ